ncbi:hypothetical protein EUX98_g2126 [Antrodiella citrinella]|uniref:Potassium channel domain-containing protein n=1 Tax=Antrodiella citrinella TaxID=2447956 RepID=A0A4S4N2S3_9APHY|nr:hypothetical protein EUX98_g2126 [Antrodiella citrinella]
MSAVSFFTRAKDFVFPPEDPAALERFIPNYRWTPIISGVVIPFSILLEIPGLTERWYIRTEGNETVETEPNPPILDAAIAISLACAVVANICLVLRFLEKRVRTTTLLTIAFLTIHDVINIVTIIIFGVEHRFNDGFTYGHSFWMTVCSTAVSSITNITLIVDFIRTPDFGISGSGLTRKQRSLVIVVIVLLVYIAFGALVNMFIMNLTFINALYFTTVTIETIGFGDITPNTTGARIFTCFYIVFGILNIGVAISMCRETVLEGLEIGYRQRMRRLRQRRREARRYRKWEVRWQRAVEWRLRELGLPVWVSDKHYEHEGVKFTGLNADGDEDSWARKLLENIGLMRSKDSSNDTTDRKHITGHPKDKHLNIDALTAQQLEASALEAGVPLEMFLDTGRPTMTRHDSTGSQGSMQSPGALERGRVPLGMTQSLHRTSSTSGWPAHPLTPTHAQVGRMAAMITKVAVAATGTNVRMVGHALEGEGDPTENRRAQNQAAEEIEEEAEEAAEEETATSPGPKPGSSVWFDDNAEKGRGPNEGCGSERPADAGDNNNNDDPPNTGLVDIGMHAPVPKWAREIAQDAHVSFSYEGFQDDIAREERRASYVKLIVAWSLFSLFWLVGSAIFHATEEANIERQSVLQEVGSSRYKGALHSRLFDNAVKQFRLQENAETRRIAHEQLSPYLRHRAHSLSKPPKVGEDTGEDDESESEAITPGLVDAVSEMAQRDLESLPADIIRQARTFHEHMQFYVKYEHGLAPEDKDRPQRQAKAPQELRALLDEIAKIEGIGEKGKREILQDEDSRKTLFMLSIERTLRDMINSAERSMAALAERDTLIALQRRRERDEMQAGPASANFTATVIISERVGNSEDDLSPLSSSSLEKD